MKHVGGSIVLWGEMLEEAKHRTILEENLLQAAKDSRTTAPNMQLKLQRRLLDK